MHILLPLFLWFLHPASVFAETPNTITVSPSIAQIDLSEDKPDFLLTYQNTTRNAVQISLAASDFTELEDGWKVNFLPEDKAKNYSYSLSSWISFDRSQFVLNPQEKTTITVHIKQDQLSPGGHYGTVMATFDQTDRPEQIALKGTLTSLLFVRTATGKEDERVVLSSATPIRSFYGFPSTVVLRLRNDGNVQTTPFGVIFIKDPLHLSVGKGIVNDGSLITLPETERRYDVAINPTSTALLPGIYTADISLHYGKAEKTIHSQVRFFMLGSLTLPLSILVLLCVGIYLKRKTLRKLIRKAE